MFLEPLVQGCMADITIGLVIPLSILCIRPVVSFVMTSVCYIKKILGWGAGLIPKVFLGTSSNISFCSCLESLQLPEQTSHSSVHLEQLPSSLFAIQHFCSPWWLASLLALSWMFSWMLPLSVLAKHFSASQASSFCFPPLSSYLHQIYSHVYILAIWFCRDKHTPSTVLGLRGARFDFKWKQLVIRLWGRVSSFVVSLAELNHTPQQALGGRRDGRHR